MARENRAYTPIDTSIAFAFSSNALDYRTSSYASSYMVEVHVTVTKYE